MEGDAIRSMTVSGRLEMTPDAGNEALAQALLACVPVDETHLVFLDPDARAIADRHAHRAHGREPDYRRSGHEPRSSLMSINRTYTRSLFHIVLL
ncbi:MAG TPA: hypothetical protein VK817_13850 [Trebonia sp.]|nr:hypothetical protein [Trebonia sp.]